MLTCDGVVAGYGELQVLHSMSLTVPKGQLVALVGANGAGKSTTLNTISGIVAARRGSITFEDQNLAGVPPHERVTRGIVQVPQGRQIFPYMSVLENLEMGSFTKAAYVQRKATLDDVYALFPVLAERRDQHAGTLSGGEQQMLAIARGLMARPRLLMLDEISLGVSPIMVQKIFETVRVINETGVTILLVEQNVTHALGLARYGYVIENGEVVMRGSSQELLSDSKLRTAFLGL